MFLFAADSSPNPAAEGAEQADHWNLSSTQPVFCSASPAGPQEKLPGLDLGVV